MTQIPYNANPELVAMKHDIAERKFNVKLKGILISAGLIAIGGVAAAAVTLAVPGSAAMLLPMAKPLLYGAAGLGSAVVGIATMKEVKKLEMDEKYIESYMQGKNYWGEGYREEVAERGYAGPALPLSAPPPAKAIAVKKL